mmetsp:Transcript_98000/g.193977  ORF Transcript_98000/g.193977 Transcript_98000/m.193977 type:complete len:106 (-) Transcript_98000:600-917(-)
MAASSMILALLVTGSARKAASVLDFSLRACTNLEMKSSLQAVDEAEEVLDVVLVLEGAGPPGVVPPFLTNRFAAPYVEAVNAACGATAPGALAANAALAAALTSL